MRILAFSSLQGPQPSKEEGWKALALAQADAAVKARLASVSRVLDGSPTPFFYEFGSTAQNNDPAFPACAAGRCVDVLYSVVGADGGYSTFSVVVDLATCAVLGLKP